VRLAVLTTHPVQYHAGWFRALAKHPGLDLEVLYCHQATPKEQAAAGFGVEFQWDVPLFDGYSYRFLKNVARDPQVNHFLGLDTPEIKEILTNNHFDAVMVNGWHYKSAWQAMRACWHTGTPVLARSDSHLHTARHAAKRLAKWPFYRWFIPKLDGCLPVGKWSRDYFLNFGARPDRIFTVPHVVDTAYFQRESEGLRAQRDVLRAGWNLDVKATIFLFAGKFTEVKRPLDFVHAIGDAARRGSSVAGLMAGDGPERAGCEDFARNNNIPISFTGFLNQSEIARAYVAADALVLPSETETWGLVVNEAMACGIPCFVSDQVGCGPDMIVPNETGEIFPVGDVDRLTSLLDLIASDQNRLARMSRPSRKKAEEYSVESAVSSVMKAVSAVCSQTL